jgi:hypothetical protein
MHRDDRVIHGSSERHVATGETASFSKEGRALPEIESFWSHIASGHNWLPDNDVIAISLSNLLNNDGICARRYQAAGKDASRLAVPDRSGERPTCRDLSNHLEPHRGCPNVGATQCIAVHGRHIGWWLAAQGNKVGGKDAAACLGEWHRFGG